MFVNFRYRGPENKSESPTLHLRITFMKELHVTIGVLYSFEPFQVQGQLCVASGTLE